MTVPGPAVLERFDVVIVGCGPVRMVLAGLLANQGVTVLALERQGQIGHRPRARHFDGEAMRVLQTVGVAEASEEIMPALGGGLRLVAADGGTLMEQRFNATRCGDQGWYDDYQMFQPLLLGVLRDHLEASGTASLRTTCEVTGVSQDGSGVRVAVHDHGRGVDEVAGASWVVGCDGADAPVGTLAAQPTLSDGRRLDDLVGYRFAVAVDADLWSALAFPLRAAVEQAPIVTVMDPEAEGSRQLLAHYGTRCSRSPVSGSTSRRRSVTRSIGHEVMARPLTAGFAGRPPRRTSSPRVRAPAPERSAGSSPPTR